MKYKHDCEAIAMYITTMQRNENKLWYNITTGIATIMDAYQTNK